MSMIKEFREFAVKGNVMDLAVGVIIGAAFGKIVTSLVEGLIMPPIGMLLGKVDFTNLYIVLDHSKGEPASLADAKAKAIPVFAYGQFINDVINFIIIAFVIFMLIRAVHRVRGVKDEPPPTKKTCPMCATEIPLEAKRCPFCTSELAA